MNLFFLRYVVVIGVIVHQATAAARAPSVTRTRVVLTPNDAFPITPAPIITPDDLRRRGQPSQICGYVSSYHGKKKGYALETLVPPACSDGYTCDVDSQYRVINCANGRGSYTRPFDFGLGPKGFVNTCQDSPSPFSVSSHIYHGSSIEHGTLFCGNGLPFCNKVTWTDMSASAWTCDASATLSYASGNFLHSSITPSMILPSLPSLSVPSITITSDSSGDVDIDAGDALSSAASREIGIAVGIVGAFIIALIMFCWRRARLKVKKSREAKGGEPNPPPEPVTEVVPIMDQPKATKTGEAVLRPQHGINLNSAVPFRLYVHPAAPTDSPADQTESTQLHSQDVSSTDAPGQNTAPTSPPPVSNSTSPQQERQESWLRAEESPSPLTSDTHHFPGRWLWDPQHRR